jgi:hypothetical protein
MREFGLKFICEKTGYELRAGQNEVMEKLYKGDDVALVATGRPKPAPIRINPGRILGGVIKAIQTQFF